jgi:hypothetical protein
VSSTKKLFTAPVQVPESASVAPAIEPSSGKVPEPQSYPFVATKSPAIAPTQDIKVTSVAPTTDPSSCGAPESPTDPVAAPGKYDVATKSDDVEVPVHIWNQRVLRSYDVITWNQTRAIAVVCHGCRWWWKKSTTRLLCSYLSLVKSTLGRRWSMTYTLKSLTGMRNGHMSIRGGRV